MAIADASWGPLPYKFPAVRSNLQAVAVIPSLSLVAHETEKRHVNRGHAKLERLEMEAEVLTKTMKYLTKDTDFLPDK